MHRRAEQKNSYQSSGIGAGNTKQGHRRLDLLGRSVGPQAVEGGSARDGELPGSGTQAGAGEFSGKHGDGFEYAEVRTRGERGEEVASEVENDVRRGESMAGWRMVSDVQLLPIVT